MRFPPAAYQIRMHDLTGSAGEAGGAGRDERRCLVVVPDAAHADDQPAAYLTDSPGPRHMPLRVTVNQRQPEVISLIVQRCRTGRKAVVSYAVLLTDR